MRSIHKLWTGLFALVLAMGAGTANASEKPETKSAEKTSDAMVGNVKTGRILFLGNSITQHKPKPGIGWTNNCGMAASSIEKDYVHVLARSVAEITGTSPVIMFKNIYHFEKGHRTYDLAQLKEQIEFKADTVILAIGENVPGVRTEDAQAQFKASVVRLLTALKDASNPTIIVRSSFWADKNKDKVLKDACAEVGGLFVDNSALGKDESNYAHSERSYKNGMVGRHPGDKGMQAIADSLLTAMKAAPTKKPVEAKKAAAVKEPAFPGIKGEWRGFDIYRHGGNIVVAPKKAAEGNPWVWRARFFDHQPQFDVAMLNKGYHLVYCHVGGRFGSPKAVKLWNKYYKTVTEEYGFAKKPILEGMSRGGLIIYNWAVANPEKVAAIYGDAPVMDFKSWPGPTHASILRMYGFKSVEEAKAFKLNPVDNLEPLAKAGIPIIHVVGDLDKEVPVAENTAIAEKRYKEMGGVFEVIHKQVGHHPHSLKDPTPIVEFMEKHVEGKK